LNTGSKTENICQSLAVVDGIIVGSSRKADGYTLSPVNEKGVETDLAEIKDGGGK
jgi:predicted TIM-barrel enzyme